MSDVKPMPEPYTKENWKNLTLGEINPVRLYATVEALAQAQRELEAAREALKNVRMLVVSRRGKVDKEVANHLLRFCSEGGVEGDILRATPTPKTEAKEPTTLDDMDDDDFEAWRSDRE